MADRQGRRHPSDSNPSSEIRTTPGLTGAGRGSVDPKMKAGQDHKHNLLITKDLGIPSSIG